MSTFSERLQDALSQHPDNPTQAVVARAAGVKSSSMADWFSGQTSAANVKAQPLIKAAAFLRVRPQWLLEGRGARNIYASNDGEVREIPPWDAWPFQTIARSRFDRLAERQKGIIEGYLLRLVEDAESNGKARAA